MSLPEGESEEFYVGYLPRAPQKTARIIRRVCIALAVIALLAAALLVFGQQPFLASFFEFGQERQFEGVVRAQPYPTLLVPRPGRTGTLPVCSRYLLVAGGKHGAAAEVGGFDGRRVRLRGSLIYRDGATMIEVAAGSVEAMDSSPAATPLPMEDLGAHTLIGEIVDSKCYLGVMNPGHTKPHRECAARCISGGIPPLFLVRDAEGRSVTLLLVSSEGQPVNQAVLDLVAEPVEITGQVARDGDQLILRADPSSYRRVP
jgi:hypothetical protein